MHFLMRILQVFISIFINSFMHLKAQNSILLYQIYFIYRRKFFEIHCILNMDLPFLYQARIYGLQSQSHYNYYLNHSLMIIYYLPKT